MKLNYDCVRDLLLLLENDLGLNSYVSIANLSEENYSREEWLYSAKKLIEAGFIKAVPIDTMSGLIDIDVREITWGGHQFLENIRPKTTWDKSKDAAKSIGGASLLVLSKIAEGLTSAFLNKQLGL